MAFLASRRELRRLLAGDAFEFGSPDAPPEPSATPTPSTLAAGPRMTELAGEIADGAFLMVGLDPAAIRAARGHLEEGARRAGRSLEGFPVVFVVTLGLGDGAVGAKWVRSWFAPGQPFLAYPSASNLRWLAEAGFDLREPFDPARSPKTGAPDRDAFGLFGPPERCADRLLRAAKPGSRVFLFPAQIGRGY